MDISIIIAHYDPGNHADCLHSFHKTLSTLSNQQSNLDIEIIIGDDGSPNNEYFVLHHTSEIDQSGKAIFCLEGEELNQWKTEHAYDYSRLKIWLYSPKINQAMHKARLGNAAMQFAQSENLLFLDDDNYFISNNSLEKIINLLNNYHLIFGQVQDSNGRFRSYSSHRVQGTTFAVKKKVIQNAGGFGEWTEAVSSGVDSDIWWKLYQYFQKHPQLKACYTSQIQTVDSCSKRWKPFIKNFFRHHAVSKEFNKVHGCINYRKPKYNPSRIKSNWLEDLT